MKNIGVFLSGCVFIGLVVLPMSLREVIVSVLVAACLFVVLQRCRERRIADLVRKTDWATWAVAVVVWVVFMSVFFYRAWCSSAVASLAVQLHVPKIVPVGGVSVCSGLSLLFLLFAANVAAEAKPEPLPCMGRREVYPRWGTLLFLFVTSVVVISLCSTCSPLYPINGWVDPNSFITVGKSMIHGKVLYRDIYDHKGPLLYMLHAVTYLISRTTFRGVWLVEIVCCFGFLWYSYKSVRLFCSGKVLFLMPALAAVVYSQKSFVSGDSVEELCLPLVAYCLYVLLKALKQGGVPSLGECVVVGITAGVVFWLKFTLCGFYVGWFVVPVLILIRSKRWAQLGRVVLAIVGGLIVVSLLVLAYFAINGALEDLYQGYFYNNIVVYGSGSGGRHLLNTSLLWGIWSMGGNSPTAVMLLGLCIVWLLRYGERRVLVGVLAMFVATYWIIFFGTTQVYYSHPLDELI